MSTTVGSTIALIASVSWQFVVLVMVVLGAASLWYVSRQAARGAREERQLRFQKEMAAGQAAHTEAMEKLKTMKLIEAPKGGRSPQED